LGQSSKRSRFPWLPRITGEAEHDEAPIELPPSLMLGWKLAPETKARSAAAQYARGGVREGRRRKREEAF